MTLHHVEINVSDLKRSEAFWSWLLTRLGYTRFQDWPMGFSYRKDATYLVFVQTEERYLDAAYHRKQTGLNHLAFHAPFQTLEAIHEECLQKGITLLYEDRYPHAGDPKHHALYFEDPDRIKVELSDE